MKKELEPSHDLYTWAAAVWYPCNGGHMPKWHLCAAIAHDRTTTQPSVGLPPRIPVHPKPHAAMYRAARTNLHYTTIQEWYWACEMPERPRDLLRTMYDLRCFACCLHGTVANAIQNQPKQLCGAVGSGGGSGSFTDACNKYLKAHEENKGA